MPSSFYRTKVFLFHRNCISYETKRSARIALRRKKNMPLMGSIGGRILRGRILF